MTDPATGGHFLQEAGGRRQVKGRQEGDCFPLKTDFVDVVCNWLVIRNNQPVVVTGADDAYYYSDSSTTPLLGKHGARYSASTKSS